MMTKLLRFPGLWDFKCWKWTVWGELWWSIILPGTQNEVPKRKVALRAANNGVLLWARKKKRLESVRLIFSKLDLPFNWSENSYFSSPTLYLLCLIDQRQYVPLGVGTFWRQKHMGKTAVLLGRWGMTAQSGWQTSFLMWHDSHWHFTHLAGRGRGKGN